MKEIARIGSWLLFLLVSIQLLSGHVAPQKGRIISYSAVHASDAASLVQSIYYEEAQLSIRLYASVETKISVYNLMGQLIASRTLTRDEEEQAVIIPMHRFQEGTYLIFIQSPEQMQSYSLNTVNEFALP